MIESSVLFFTLMMIMFYMDFYFDRFNYLSTIGFLFFSCLAILQKSTTALPAIVVLFFLSFYKLYNKHLIEKKINKNSFFNLVLLFIPIALGFLWVSYTDNLKSTNYFAHTLTSKNLFHWNIGTFDQRFSIEFMRVILNNIIKQEISGFLGVYFILFFIFFNKNYSLKLLTVLFLFFLLPLIIFTPLHIVHDYYQYSCVIFLIAILAYTITYLNFENKNFKKFGILFLTLTFVSINYYNGYSFYFKKAKIQFTEMSNLKLAISSTILSNTNSTSSLVGFGDDWSSELPFYSKRKSFMVKTSFKGFDSVWNNPDKFMGGKHIDAIVFFIDGKVITIDKIMNYPYKKGYGLFCLEPNVYLMIWSKNQIFYRNTKLNSIL